MFHVSEGGSLTLQNIVLDGQKNFIPSDPLNRSLILVSGTYSETRRSSSPEPFYTEGEAFIFRQLFLSSHFLMTEDSQICDCSPFCGGAVMAAAKHPDDKFAVLDALWLIGRNW